MTKTAAEWVVEYLTEHETATRLTLAEGLKPHTTDKAVRSAVTKLLALDYLIKDGVDLSYGTNRAPVIFRLNPAVTIDPSLLRLRQGRPKGIKSCLPTANELRAKATQEGDALSCLFRALFAGPDNGGGYGAGEEVPT